MPRSEGQKLKLLYLKQIFEEYSDENHGLTMEQILAHLSHNGVTAERKSIYMDIAVLTDEYGMDIELDKAAKPPVYKLMSRNFELPELKMMVHIQHVWRRGRACDDGVSEPHDGRGDRQIW